MNTLQIVNLGLFIVAIGMFATFFYKMYKATETRQI